VSPEHTRHRKGREMGRESLPVNSALYLEDGFWKLSWNNRSATANEPGSDAEHGVNPNGVNHPIWVGMASGPKGLSREEAQQIVWRMIVSQARAQQVAQHSSMTLGEFVERKFVPEYVASKGFSGRMHYQSMLKHVLRPEEVDRLFRAEARRPKVRLRSVEDWPYIGDVPLREVRPESVQHLATAALSSGYSTQTVMHIRNVVSTIFSYAQLEMYFSGDNPASAIKLPKLSRPQLPSLAISDLIRLLGFMRYPEKEMTLMAVLTGMTVAEICGLQWKRVNLTDVEVSNSNGEAIPPRALLVREEWMRGQLGAVSKRRVGTLRIPKPLLPILVRLNRNPRFAGQSDFVLTSRSGSPVNQTNVLTRRLKPIGLEMNIPGLSWHMVRRIHKELVTEYGAQFQDQMMGMVRTAFPSDFKDQEHWRASFESDLPY
jgi:integrase